MSDELRVAVLASAVGGTHGIGRATRGLLRGLGSCDHVTIVPVVPPAARGAVERLGLPNADDPVLLATDSQLGVALQERYALGRRLAGARVDVVHGLKHLVPRGPRPTVLTVYDVLTLTWPEQFDRAKRMLLPRQFRASLDAATVLIAISETTRQRLGSIDARWIAKTTVVPIGRTDELSGAVAAPVDALDGRRFAVVVGDLSPRKNVRFLVDMWREVHAVTGLTLAVVGTAGWRSHETREELDALVGAGLALWARDVSDGQLRWCYEHAAVALFPTLEEGYGIPIVEALSFGVPVVASTDPAVVEVARGQARHVDVADRAAWVSEIEVAVSREHEPVDVGALTWAENAAATVEVYRRALTTTERA